MAGVIPENKVGSAVRTLAAHIPDRAAVTEVSVDSITHNPIALTSRISGGATMPAVGKARGLHGPVRERGHREPSPSARIVEVSDPCGVRQERDHGPRERRGGGRQGRDVRARGPGRPPFGPCQVPSRGLRARPAPLDRGSVSVPPHRMRPTRRDPSGLPARRPRASKGPGRAPNVRTEACRGSYWCSTVKRSPTCSYPLQTFVDVANRHGARTFHPGVPPEHDPGAVAPVGAPAGRVKTMVDPSPVLTWFGAGRLATGSSGRPDLWRGWHMSPAAFIRFDSPPAPGTGRASRVAQVMERLTHRG